MTALLAMILTGASVQDWQHFTHYGSVSDIALAGSTVVTATSGGVAFGTLQGSFVAWDSVWTCPGELSHSDCRVILLEQGPPRRYWVGTWGGGMDIYTEGSGWQHYGQLDGLPIAQQVSSICLSDTAVFAGTSQGLAIKQYGYFQVWTQLNTGGGLLSDGVECLLSDGSGLLVGTDAGLTTLAAGAYPGSAGSWTEDPTLLGRSIRAMCYSGDTLWAATDEGLWFRPAGSAFSREEGYPGDSPYCVCASEGRLAAGEDGEVAIRIAGSWEIWSTFAGQISRRLAFAGDSLILVGTSNDLAPQKDCGAGLARGWGSGWSASYPPGPTANDMRAVAVGPSGECWTSTNHAGLDLLHDGTWYSFVDIFPTVHQMFALVSLPGGGVFVSHYHYGVTYLDWHGTPGTGDDEHFSLDSGNSGLLNDQIISMAAGPDGTVWFGQEPYFSSPSEPSGVSRLQWSPGDLASAQWMSWSAAGGLPSGKVSAVADAGDGTAWIGTETGIVRVGPGAGDISQVIGTSQGLPSADVRSLALGRNGDLYAGTTSGLALVDQDAFTASAVAGVAGTVSSIAFDHLGAVWAAGTEALYRIAPDGSVEAYNTYNSPLLSTVIYGMAGDADDGFLYLATDCGLWRLELGNGLSGEGGGAVLYPNPFVPGRGEVLGVAGIPDMPTTMRVFDLGGRLVYECSSPDRQGIAWDGDGSDGSPVASGVYMVEVKQSGSTRLLKLGIVR